MKITDIQPQKNKNRVNIFLDGEFACGLQKDSAIDFRLKIGQECSRDKLSEIIADSEYKRALEKALKYLAPKMRTQNEIEQNLYNKGFCEATAAKVIARLKELDFVDDAKYAKMFSEQSADKMGILMMRSKLLQHGVDKQDIDAALEDKAGQADGAKKLAAKYMRSKEFTKENKQKLMRYLAGRGFLYDDIRTAADRIFGEGASYDD